MFLGLIDVGDKLLVPEDEPRGFIDFHDNSGRARVVARQVLEKLPASERAASLKEAIHEAPSLATISDLVRFLRPREDRERPTDDLLTTGEVEEISEALRDRIRRASRDGSLIEMRKLQMILYAWWEIGPKEEQRAWAEEQTTDDKSLARTF